MNRKINEKSFFNKNEYRQQTKKIFENYLYYKFLLKNNNTMKMINPKQSKKIKKQVMLNYIQCVDDVLENLDQHYSKILIKVIEKKQSLEDLHFSDAWIYKSLDRACKEFSRYFSCQ
ncbi:hypothetical protein [Mycoplasma amphoriforme]|uniref:hypothetical protein n=1 Tax=Mycoplasma amphoriforme TaxID=273136 RepID=UPI0031B9B2A3